MFKSNPNKISYVFIFTASATLVLIILYLGLGMPTIRYINKIKAELKSKQAKLLESQELIRSLPNPQKAMEEMEQKVKEFKEMGISKKQLPRLIQLLGKAAADLNINVTSIRPRDDIKSPGANLPEGVTKVHMEVILNCSYQMLADYIKAVGALPVAFSLESLSVTKKEENNLSDSKTTGKSASLSTELQATLLLSTFMVWEL
jgi:Tfp pilus assembly protein PilO